MPSTCSAQRRHQLPESQRPRHVFGHCDLLLLLVHPAQGDAAGGGICYDAIFFILLILCFAWGGDTCAYFAGRAFGKHKLCPVVSPKKTVEGAVGGVLGTMVFGVLVTVIYSIAADRMEEFTRSNIGVSMYVIIALLACVAAVLGIYGDLFASVVKRQCGIKDYGTIFPGHGGILDRFDSVMFIAPFVTMVVIAAFYD